jgi:hypothetical protein
MKKEIIEGSNQKVILNDDGTWEFYESIDDIINYSKEDLIVEETDKMTNETSFRSKDVIYIPGRYEEQRITFYAATEQNEEYLFLAPLALVYNECRQRQV